MHDVIDLKLIHADPEIQPRAELNEQVIGDYGESLRSGEVLPPVDLFYDGETHWLADGFHRFHAHQNAELPTIPVRIQQGGRRDAILFACGANRTHGLRRSNDDKRNAVAKLFRDKEWGRWSDREIARRCGVSNTFVGDVRKNLARELDCQPLTVRPRQGADGRTINTANIGPMSKGRTSGDTDENEETDVEPQAPGDADAPRLDQAGVPIPEHLLHLFDLNLKFDRAVKHLLVVLRDDVLEIQNTLFPDVDRQKIPDWGFPAKLVWDLADHIGRIFEKHRIRYVCSCDGKGCRHCHGKGFLSKKPMRNT